MANGGSALDAFEAVYGRKSPGRAANMVEMPELAYRIARLKSGEIQPGDDQEADTDRPTSSAYRLPERPKPIAQALAAEDDQEPPDIPDVVQGLIHIMNADIRDMYTPDGQAKPYHQWPDHFVQAVDQITPTAHGQPNVKLASKISAANALESIRIRREERDRDPILMALSQLPRKDKKELLEVLREQIQYRSIMDDDSPNQAMG